MSKKALVVDDLADRTHVIDVELHPAVRAALQAAADERGMTLEEYVRGLAHTTAAVMDAQRNSADEADEGTT
jgi:hypothetical protein